LSAKPERDFLDPDTWCESLQGLGAPQTCWSTRVRRPVKYH